ncbi:phytoene desaturase family protein [Alkalicoccus chagannorensis]|uniref:phytoene desaturase family protein n=1 Tax=Alkalicoccus chagannorensis TaxID=427072 RepID=UPI0003FC9684|nr:phytoene desaturase family protein [Alkalicoccus chagannorensis]
MTKRAVVIGAGLGGLAAAVTLQHAGFHTTVLEKHHHPGGKMHEVKVGGASFDFGPNTITMPAVFEEVIRRAGGNPEKYMQFHRLRDHTKNEFHDGTSFVFSSNKEKMKEELLPLDPYAADHYDSYLEEVTKLYHLAEKSFLRRTFRSWKDYLSLPLARALLSSRPHQTMNSFHAKYFKDPRVRAAFNRYATYIGSSPFNAPATFSLIGHLELRDGVYYAEGGNFNIAEGIKQFAEDIGVVFRWGEQVHAVEAENGSIKRAVTEKAVYPADVMILNGDLLTQVPALIKEKHRPSLPDRFFQHLSPSVSAFVLMAELNTTFPLHHHHVFFGPDPGKEFEDIFDRRQYGKSPAVYLCTNSKTDPSRSPNGDNPFILINAPPVSPDTKALEAEDVWRFLEPFGMNLAPFVKAQRTVTPGDIRSTYAAYRGALYGLSSNEKKNTFLRPYNQSKDLPNLFFAGGSTHPGGGSPIVTLSGMNAGKAAAAWYGK